MNNRFQISLRFPVKQTIHSDLSCRKYEALQDHSRIGKIMQIYQKQKTLINTWLLSFQST